jgi:hypothetical protein
MENGVLVSESGFACTELFKILNSLWNNAAVQANFNATCSMRHQEINASQVHVVLCESRCRIVLRTHCRYTQNIGVKLGMRFIVFLAWLTRWTPRNGHIKIDCFGNIGRLFSKHALKEASNHGSLCRRRFCCHHGCWTWRCKRHGRRRRRGPDDQHKKRNKTTSHVAVSFSGTSPNIDDSFWFRSDVVAFGCGC